MTTVPAPSLILCGSLRAGTTMTKVLLKQHSQIYEHGESDFYFDGLGATLDGSDTPEQRRHFQYEITNGRIPREQKIVPPPLGPVREMILDLLRQQTTQPQNHLLLTLHRHFDLAAQMFPDAVFIRLRRDPRDVALSSIGMGWAGNAYYGVVPWIVAERSWQQAMKAGAPKNVIDVAFEDLTANAESELSRIIAPLGLSFEESMINPRNTTYSAPTPTRNFAWKSSLSEEEAAEIAWRIGDVGAGCGYDLGPAREPSASRKLALKSQDVLFRQRFDINRYGPRLWAESHVARRVGSLDLRAKVRHRRDAIDQKYLK